MILCAATCSIAIGNDSQIQNNKRCPQLFKQDKVQCKSDFKICMFRSCRADEAVQTDIEKALDCQTSH